jgi:hypothetical protein
MTARAVRASCDKMTGGPNAGRRRHANPTGSGRTRLTKRARAGAARAAASGDLCFFLATCLRKALAKQWVCKLIYIIFENFVKLFTTKMLF